MMTHMNNTFLTVENNALVAYFGNNDTVPVVITRENVNLLEGQDVLCSSSIDFPAEHTTDAAVLTLIGELFPGSPWL